MKELLQNLLQHKKYLSTDNINSINELLQMDEKEILKEMISSEEMAIQIKEYMDCYNILKMSDESEFELIGEYVDENNILERNAYHEFINIVEAKGDIGEQLSSLTQKNPIVNIEMIILELEDIVNAIFEDLMLLSSNERNENQKESLIEYISEYDNKICNRFVFIFHKIFLSKMKVAIAKQDINAMILESRIYYNMKSKILAGKTEEFEEMLKSLEEYLDILPPSDKDNLYDIKGNFEDLHQYNEEYDTQVKLTHKYF